MRMKAQVELSNTVEIAMDLKHSHKEKENALKSRAGD
jgi:hypothetical protein